MERVLGTFPFGHISPALVNEVTYLLLLRVFLDSSVRELSVIPGGKSNKIVGMSQVCRPPSVTHFNASQFAASGNV